MMQDDPRLDGILTREQFAAALTRIREVSGWTVDGIAVKLAIAKSTVGGWFGGSNLPGPRSLKSFRATIKLCGIEEQFVESWVATSRRLLRRRQPGRVVAPAQRTPDPSELLGATMSDPVWRPMAAPDVPALSAAEVLLARSSLVSIRPPFGRLDREPKVHDRDELLAELTAALRRGGAPAVVLHGLGGVGKSTVALTVASHAEQLGHDVWWVDAGSTETLLAGMHALAVDLGATQEQLPNISPDVLWRLLEARQRRWLLVLDNADHPDATLAALGGQVTDGNGWLRAPRGEAGMVLATTSDGSRATWGNQVPRWIRLHGLDGLSAAAGAAMLRELAGPEAGSVEDAEHLARLLGGLPLGLRLAGRYLRNAAGMPVASGAIRSFRDFSRAMRDGGTVDPLADPALVGDATDRRAQELVGRTWQPSFGLLAERGLPHARALLRLLSCFDQAPLSVNVVAHPQILAKSRLLPAHLSINAVWACIRALAELGLAELFTSDRSEVVTVHPLVRAASLSADDFRPDAARYAALAADLMSQTVRNRDARDPQSWQAWSQVVDHVHAPLALSAEQQLEPTPEQAERMVRLGRDAAAFLRSTGQLGPAEASLVRTVQLSSELLGVDQRLVLLARSDLARVRYVQGLLIGAERQFEDLLPLIRADFENDPETLTTMHYLGRVRHDLGKASGEAMLRDALTRRRRTLGEDHRDTLTTRCMVGECLRTRGALDAAARELAAVLQLLDGRRPGLSHDHPLTLVVRGYLTRVRLDQHDYEGAHALATQVTADSTRVLGHEHPRTLAAIDTLIAALHGLRRLPEAVDLARRLLGDRARVLGPDHPSTLQTRHQLGLLLIDQGVFDEADRELRAAAEAAHTAHGVGSPIYQAIRDSLNALQLRPRANPAKTRARARVERDATG